VQATLNDLCKQHHIPSPKVAIEHGGIAWPTTISILPFTRFCVIRISDALVEKLTPTQLRLVLAHELGHAKKHVKKLWLTQLFSCLSLISPAYFTILLNYWKIEMEADDFAVQITEQPLELISLLEELDTMTAAAEAEAEKERWERLWLQSEAQAQGSGRRADRTTSSPKHQLAMVYKMFFGDAIWGAAHPPNEVRKVRLGQRTEVVARSEIEEHIQELDQDSRDSAQDLRGDKDIPYHPTEAARSLPSPLVNYVKQELFQIQIEVAKFAKNSYVRELILENDPRQRLKKYQQIQEELAHEQYDGLAAELRSECLQYEDNLKKLRQKIRPRHEMAEDARYFALKDDILAYQSMLTQTGNALDQKSKAWITNKIEASKQAQIATERGRIIHQITRMRDHINQLKSLQQLLPLTRAPQMPTVIERQ